MQKIYLLVLLLVVTTISYSQTTYYSKASATDFTSTASWGTATDGTGAAPASISNADNFIISNAAAMNLNAGSASVRLLTISSGSLTVNSNTLTVSISGAYNSTLSIAGGTLTVGGGNVVVNGNFSVGSGGKLTQTGGTISVDGNNAGSATGSVASGTNIVSFAPTANTDITLSGGTFIIVDPHYTTTTTFSCNIPSTGATAASGTHTFKFGDGVSTDNGGTNGFQYYAWVGTGIFKFKNVILETVTGGSNRFVQMNGTYYNFVATGDVTINSGAELRNLSASSTTGATYLSGNLINNGTITSTGTVFFADAVSSGSTTLSVSAATSAQSVSGTGVFRNLTASPTANYNSITINNTSSGGVTFSSSASLLSGTNTGTVSGTLTFTTGIVNTGSNSFILGISTASTGTLSYTAGGFATGSTFGRWYAAATAGTTVSASSLPSTGAGTYPFAVGSNARDFHIYRPSTTGATGGVISVQYNDGSGLNTISTVTDGSYSIDRQSAATWVVSTSNGFAAGTGTFTYAVSGQGIYTYVTTNGRLMKSATVVGTHQTGTSLPLVERTAIAAVDFTGTFYIGLSSTDVPFQTAQSGKWESTSTWVGGVVPGCSNPVLILSGHTVTIDGTTGTANTVGGQINTGGGLTISGGTFNVGCSANNNYLINNGTLTVSSGIVNLNGYLAINNGSSFTHSGGNIIIDGNANNVTGNSVPSGTPIFGIGTSVTAYSTGTVTLSGGTITITDPHTATTNTNGYAIYANLASGVNINSSGTHTVQLGDGVSTESGGNTSGFYITGFAGSGRLNFYNLTVNSASGTNRSVNQATTVSVIGNLTVTSGTYSQNSNTLNLGGNLSVANGASVVASSTLVFALPSGTSTSAQTTAQNVSVAGTGTISNLSASATANFTSVTINNTSSTGVTIPVLNAISGQQSNTASISSTLTFTAGRITTSGGCTVVLGITSSAGTLSVTSGGFASGSSYGRWSTSAGTGSTISAGADPTTTTSRFPFVDASGNNRSAWVQRVTPTAAGIIALTYTDASTVSNVSITDGAYTVGKRYDGTWSFSTLTTTPTATSFTLAIVAPGAYGASTTNSRILLAAAAANGTHQNGTTTPGAQRTGLTLAQLTAAPFYIGIASSEAYLSSVASGAWENGSTWDGGVVPTSASNVFIASGHTVTVNGAAAAAAIINNGGTLTVSGSTLTVTGAATTGITNTGTFNLSGGTVNVGADGSNDRRFSSTAGTVNINSGTFNMYGNFSVTGGAFNQSGGLISVNGNNGTSAVASGTHFFTINTSGTINANAGIVRIVNPPATTSTRSVYVDGQSNATSFTGTHTFEFGDGTSTVAGSTEGFVIETYSGSRLPIQNVTVNSANGGTNRFVRNSTSTANGTFIKGNLTINSGGEFRWVAETTDDNSVGGNIVNNGTLTSLVHFSMGVPTSTPSLYTPSASQTISGSGTFQNLTASPTASFALLNIYNTGGTVTISPDLSISSSLTVNDGTLSAGTLTFNGASTQTVSLSAATSTISLTNLALNNSVTLSGSGKLNVTGAVSFGNVNTKTLTAAGLLYLKSSASGTARIADITNAGANTGNVISGNVIVERYVGASPRKAWRLFGANVTSGSAPTIRAAWQEGATSAASNPNPGYGTHITAADGSTTGGYDASLIATASSLRYFDGNALQTPADITTAKVTDNGGAYFLYVRGDRSLSLTTTATLATATTLRMTGTVNQGNVTVGKAGIGVSFSLIPNPYPSNIDFELVRSGNGSSINTYYVWDANLGTLGAFRTIDRLDNTPTYQQTPSGGSPATDATARYIMSGQAFWIPAQTTLNFTETMKVSSNPANNPFRTAANNEEISVNLSIKQGVSSYLLADGVRARFSTSYSNAVTAEDAIKMTNFGENLGIARSGKVLSIEKRGALTENDTIFLKLWNTTAQEYRFTVNPANIGAGLEAYLEDLYLHTSKQLNTGTSTDYDFSINSDAGSKADNRFRIVLRAMQPIAAGEPGVSIYPNPVTGNTISLYLNNIAKGTYKVNVYNVTGQLVATKQVEYAGGTAAEQVGLPASAAKGVYRVEIKNAEARYVHNIVKQ